MIEDKLLDCKGISLSRDDYDYIMGIYRRKLDSLVEKINNYENIFGVNKNVVIFGSYAYFFKSKLRDEYYMLNFVVAENIENLGFDEKYFSEKLFARSYDVMRG